MTGPRSRVPHPDRGAARRPARGGRGVRQICGRKLPSLFLGPFLNVLYQSGREAPVEPSLESLESRRKELYRKLEALGDFRRGTISVNYRK